MGRQDVTTSQDPLQFRAFTKALLTDLRALDQMIRDGRIESGVRRIGAEQEMFLVDRGWRPAPLADEVLANLGKEFTTEIALFNLEVNLPPLDLGGDCFSRLHATLNEKLGLVQAEAHKHRAEVVLTGILPTLSKSDLSLDNMTPRERYQALSTAINQMSGGVYRVQIQGADELNFEHDSVMLEGGNTSFQVHLQVDPAEFPLIYNVAQAVTAPLVACAVNSPMLFGRRLWAETRIALFQQAIDTRRSTRHVRELAPRVRFGEQWVKDSVLEVFQEDIARIPALLGSVTHEDPLELLREGKAPDLSALQLYNSTVYRWNRPCYGVHNGVPHLRIECRVLPAGPSTLDEVANAAFWVGMLVGGVKAYPDITSRMAFSEARANVLAAARRGLNGGFTWLDSKPVSAPDLILEELIPLARVGLEESGIAGADIDKYLGVIQERVETRMTGAHWLERSLEELGTDGTQGERLAALTAAMSHYQQLGLPGHRWEAASLSGSANWRQHYVRVEQYMTTDLFTVKKDELVDLAALLMDWKGVRQVPVEDEDHRLIGLLSYGAVLRALATARPTEGELTIPVQDLMDPAPVTVSPETTTLEAIELMRAGKITSLPVVKDEVLVGIVSIGDFMPIAQRLLQEKLGEDL
jgi:CBS domain-containing protein